MLNIPKPLIFDWDKNNIDKNWKKHQVDFKEAEEVFFNHNLGFFPDPKHSKSEPRFYTLGVTSQKRKLAIFFTTRHQKIRIISARNMSGRERKTYEQKK